MHNLINTLKWLEEKGKKISLIILKHPLKSKNSKLEKKSINFHVKRTKKSKDSNAEKPEHNEICFAASL